MTQKQQLHLSAFRSAFEDLGDKAVQAIVGNPKAGMNLDETWTMMSKLYKEVFDADLDNDVITGSMPKKSKRMRILNSTAVMIGRDSYGAASTSYENGSRSGTDCLKAMANAFAIPVFLMLIVDMLDTNASKFDKITFETEQLSKKIEEEGSGSLDFLKDLGIEPSAN